MSVADAALAIALLSKDERNLLLEVCSRTTVIDKALKEPLFNALAVSTYESAPPEIKAVDERSFRLILAMGYDIGCNMTEIRAEEK
jgi:hypothetical protein